MFSIILSLTAAFLLLIFSFLAISRQKNPSGITLSATALLLAGIEVLNQISLNSAADHLTYKWAAIVLESLLPFTLLVFSITYAREKPLKSVAPVWWVLIALSTCFPASLFFFQMDDFFFSPDFPSERILFLGDAGYWFYIAIMLYLVVALMNIEATFSATSGLDRWRIKLEVTGIISILAIMIFYYSQGLLYRTINMNLLPVRSAVVMVASLLAVYSKTVRGKKSHVTVSRYIFYRSLSLLVVGIYLITLGLIGEGMKYFDISFSRHMVIFFAFTGGMFVLLLLLSETLRRRVKVFISKHFYKHKYDYREEWLKFTDRLAACRTFDEAQETAISAFRETFHLKDASLYLLDRAKKSYLPAKLNTKSANSFSLKESAGIIAYFRELGRVFNAGDKEYALSEDETTFVQESEAALIVPLIFNKNVEGFIVFGRGQADREFNYEDYDLMKMFARQSALSIISFKLAEELAETKEVAALGRISSFIIHDLKNLTYALSLTLDNAEDHISNPDFQKDMIDSIKSTLSRMKTLIQKLKSIPEKQSLNTKLSDLHLLARDTTAEIGKMRNDVRIVCNGSPVVCLIDEEEIRKVFLNLVLNAVDALVGNGLVTVETGIDGETGYIRVSDNGSGITEEFIQNHLFKPFRTTKNKGLGIGLYQCKQVVEAHGGTITAESNPGVMTVFTVYLPAADTTD